ncbi:MAG: hypothetical protein WCR67_05715 [Bacilli bacterium]
MASRPLDFESTNKVVLSSKHNLSNPLSPIFVEMNTCISRGIVLINLSFFFD